MPVQNARLTVRDWDGTLRHERYYEHLNPAMQFVTPANGMEVRRTGFGGCLELTFQSLWATLGIGERDVVELDVQDQDTWTREFAGVALKTGNSETPGHSNFKIVGLKKRLQEVRIVNDPVSGDVGAQLRSALQDLITSGQLGEAIVYDAALIPDLGVELDGFAARNRKASELFDFLAATGHGVWDVNADRKVFLRPAALGVGDTLALTEGADVTVTYEDTDSEALVTRVLFTLGQWSDGSLIQTEVGSPAEAEYGTAWTEITYNDPQAWRVTAHTFAKNNAEAITSYAALTDRLGTETDGAPTVILKRTSGGTGEASLTLTLTEPARRIRVELAVAGDGTKAPDYNTEPSVTTDVLVPRGTKVGELTITLAGNVVVQVVPVYTRTGGTAYLTEWIYTPSAELPAGTTVTYTTQGAQTASLIELRPEAFNAEVLEGIAGFHFVLPQRDPTQIRVRGRVTPRPKVTLMKAAGGTYENPVEEYSLHIKAGEDLSTVLKAGQREGAEARAQRWLGQIALRDATLEAVRFGTGGL
ncbi:hypothetical protein [Deinococcus multiflagellatus]|uniref:hypothetical protein n=1 Tax=Deinococcus multiflagellatus TaxID=1656887 RepID=UPI001CCE9F7A|nr:hypothetical protein [Deinococcus multiflagellatus]MBZ9712176.1 hypothetical protein [Deinococcus multiflagellatus]